MARALWIIICLTLPAVAGFGLPQPRPLPQPGNAIKPDIAPPAESVTPGAAWAKLTPAQAGLSAVRLDELRQLVGGRGVVVRHGAMVYSWGDVSRSGDVASAVKPVISTLLFMALQEGKIKSVDDPVADFEPGLLTLNGGKDAKITWRHLASQSSGYGHAEAPGEAYSYNDFALALYYRVLTEKVFAEKGTNLLESRLARPLGFEDSRTFEKGKPGRLSISVRDFARFGLLYLRGGKWNQTQLIGRPFIEQAISSPLAPATPLTSGREAPMLPGQTSLGGGKNQTKVGPGVYSFNWWLNGLDGAGRRLFVDGPPDLYVASGHGGKRALWIFPSLDLIVCWNDSPIADHDASPGNPDTRTNQAVRLIIQAVRDHRSTRLSIAADQWRINDAPTNTGPPASAPGTKTPAPAPLPGSTSRDREGVGSPPPSPTPFHAPAPGNPPPAQGLLMNVRMANALFEDRTRPDFEPEANTDRLIARIDDYAAQGVSAFTICLQGGMPGYEGAINSAFGPDGTLDRAYMRRAHRLAAACDRRGVSIILGCYYQRQDQHLKDEAAIKAGVRNVAQWVRGCGLTNVALEIANEYPHGGFDHPILRTPAGQVELMRLARAAAPGLLVSTSGIGDGKLPDVVAAESDFPLIHFNGVKLEDIPARIKALQKFGKPIVCNEDDRTGSQAALAAEACVMNRASYGLMLQKQNQTFPFAFSGAADDPVFYDKLKNLTGR